MDFIMEKSFYHNFYYGTEKPTFQSTFEWLFSLNIAEYQKKISAPYHRHFQFISFGLRNYSKSLIKDFWSVSSYRDPPRNFTQKQFLQRYLFKFSRSTELTFFLVAAAEKVLCAMLGACSKRLSRFYFYTYSLHWLLIFINYFKLV